MRARSVQKDKKQVVAVFFESALEPVSKLVKTLQDNILFFDIVEA